MVAPGFTVEPNTRFTCLRGGSPISIARSRLPPYVVTAATLTDVVKTWVDLAIHHLNETPGRNTRSKKPLRMAG